MVWEQHRLQQNILKSKERRAMEDHDRQRLFRCKQLEREREIRRIILSCDCVNVTS